MELLKKVDVSIENKVIGYMVTSTPILNEIRNIVDPSHFESPIARIVSGWVIDFYDRTNEAPGKAIADIYMMKKDSISEADAQLVYAFLQNCSEKWQPTNFEYSKKITVDYIQERSMKKLVERLNSKVGTSIQECQAIIAEYIKPETYHSKSIDILNDSGFVSNAFNEEDEELFVLPGDLGKVTGNFCRGDFVSFLAPPKRGKTWWMMDLAMTAFLQGCKVLFISLEMTEKQMARRFWQFLSGCSRDGKEADSAYFEPIGEDRWELIPSKYNTIKVDNRIESIEKIQANFKKYSNGGELKLRRYDTGSLSLRDLKNELKTLEMFENFVPDVIVLDYADIMKMNNTKDKRFSLDELWLGLRGLNMETNSCLITASQAGRATVTGDKDADESDIAEAVSKLNHVTKMITINQNKEDKKNGVYRLNCNTTRDGGVVYDTAVVTSCLAIGRPYMDCHLLGNVDMGRTKDDSPKVSQFHRS